MPTERPQPEDESHDTIVIRPPRAVHRWGIGLNVALQILLLLLLLGVLNYLSFRQYKRWDLSYTKDYSLSDTTTKMLQALPAEVDLVVAFVRTSPIANDVNSLVEEYKHRAGARINVTYIDPARNPSGAEEAKVQYGISLERNGIIVSSEGRTRFIREDEIFYSDPSHMGDRAQIEFRGEDALTSAMISVSEEGQKPIYVLSGKGPLRTTKNGTAIATLDRFAASQNAKILPLDITTAKTVPEDAAAVILINPKYDLTDREVTLLRSYWERRNGALLVLLNPESPTPNLDEFVGEYGIHPQDDRVLYSEATGAGTRKQYSVQSVFVPGSRLTAPFRGASTTFGGQPRSLKVEERSDELARRRIEAIPLIEATERYWGETNYRQQLPILDEKDSPPPIFVAASAELGALTDESLRLDSSRLVVIGNATLIDPDMTIASNYDFIAASLNWMLDREDLIGIPPKVKSRFRLNLSPHQHQRVFMLIAITLPGLVLAIGFVVWTLRRN